MAASSLIAERTARRVSPAFSVAGIICFFFTFAGVSCNSSALNGVLGAAGLNGTASPSGTAAASCLKALQDRQIVSYSGFTLVFGGTPDVLTTLPSACPNASPQVTAQATDLLRSGVSLGVQPLEVVAAIALVLALAVSLLGVFGTGRGAIRLPLGGGLALLALLMALLEQTHLQTAVIDRLNAFAAQQGAPFSVAAYVSVSNGLAYILLLIVLGVGALYQLAAGFFGEPRVAIEVPARASPVTRTDAEPVEEVSATSD